MNAEDDDPHTRLMYFDLMDLVAWVFHLKKTPKLMELWRFSEI
jgi:hypothetical protein